MNKILYRPEIDGLRAFAVIFVIFYHAEFTFFKGGFIGVDIFFVISGYLIAAIINKNLKNDKQTFYWFLESRSRRIIPALYIVCIFSILPAWFILFPENFHEFSESLISVPLFLSNYVFSTRHH